MQQLEKGEMPMVAGRLQEKNGFYYIVLSYTDSAGKRSQPWIGTGLPVKGNKKRAERDAVRPIRSVSGICTFFAPPGDFGTRIGEGGGCAARR